MHITAVCRVWQTHKEDEDEGEEEDAVNFFMICPRA